MSSRRRPYRRRSWWSVVVFALAGAHGMPSAWLASRHTLVAAALAVSALWTWARYREDEPEKARAERFRVLSLARHPQRLHREAGNAFELEVLAEVPLSNPIEDMLRSAEQPLTRDAQLPPSERPSACPLGESVEIAHQLGLMGM